MRWANIAALRVRSLFRRADVERDLDDELRYHIEQQIAEHVKRGLSPDDARRAALVAMGGVETQKEQVRDTRGTRAIEELGRDVRYALRSLRRSPGFTIIAALTLALGIGANTALFTLLDKVLLRPLPVRDPEGLVIVQRVGRAPDGNIRPRSMPYPAFERLRAENTTLSEMTAMATTAVAVRIANGRENLPHGAAVVTGDFFSVLGVGARVGRVIVRDDDRAGAPPIAVLSHRYWSARFDNDENVIGRTIDVYGSPFTIVGVTPPGFFGVNVGTDPDVYFPMAGAPTVFRSKEQFAASNGFLSAFGRLRPGVTPRQAAEQLTPMYLRARIETGGGVVDQETLKRFEGTAIAVEPGSHGLSFLRTQFGKPLVVLMAMVALVLAVACGNIANLVLARTVARRREIDIRLSLGASRWRVVRQLATENFLLAMLGGALGLTLARAGNRVLIALLDSGGNWLTLDVRPDARVLAFTFAVSLCTAVAFGLLPVFHVTRSDLASAMRERGRGLVGGPRGHLTVGRGLVVAQVALSVVLLVGTGLFVRTLLALRGIDLGFARENVVVLHTDPRVAGYTGARLAAVYETIATRTAALPGVRDAAFADITPLSGSSTTTTIRAEGYTPAPGERNVTFLVRATPNYFATMGLPLRTGRVFQARPAGQPREVVVNEAFVRQYLPGGALGRHIGFDDSALPPDIEIVGVVKDSPLRELRERVLPLVYLAASGDTTLGSAFVVARTTSSTKTLAAGMREVLRTIDPRFEIIRLTTLESQVDATMSRERLTATIATFFGALALLLASIGLYGVVSQGVVRRTNEIGVRMALGASSRAVSSQIMRDASRTVVLGIAIGLPVSLLGARGVAALLYGVRAADATTFGLSIATLMGVALAASYFPARRAARIDPAVALRAD